MVLIARLMRTSKGFACFALKYAGKRRVVGNGQIAIGSLV